MAHERSDLRKPPIVGRRPAFANTVGRSAASGPAISPAQALQRRLGNQGTQALLARTPAAAPAISIASPVSVQYARISQPTDPAELEAERVARKVVQMGEPAAREGVAAETPAGKTVQRAAAPSAPAPAAAAIPTPPIGGAPLPSGVRGFMEPRFNANFGNVRIHTGEAAAQQSAMLSAHAFTVGEHIFFGRNQYQPESASGRELIAHELTHTIQQGGAVQRSADSTIALREPVMIQRFGISDALDWIADKLNYIPGFRLLTIVLGVNPVTMTAVDRSATNLLRALLELIPVAGPLIAQALDAYGILPKVGAWFETQVHMLGLVGGAIKGALNKFLDSLSWRDILSLGDVWERGKAIFTEPIDRLINFGKSLVSDILKFIRDAILLPLARLAEGTRGYDLLKAVLGQDPITGEVVPRTPDALIGGFMKLIGQEEIWENIKKSNAIPRAWAWFQAALGSLMAFLRQIPAMFINALKSLEIADLVLPWKAFAKVVGVFGDFVGHVISWAGGAVWNLLEIIFDVVSPGALQYIKKTGAALKSILRNPLPFLGNLIRAAKLGFQNFANNFLDHLKAGLFDWLTGSLPGVYIPKAFSLVEIGKFAFSVLGISWANIRAKLVQAVGETAVKTMEAGFDIVVALVRDGPAAAWDKIKEQLTNLKDMVIGGLTDLVVDAVVKKAIPKLLSMFIPGAGFISAILSIYDTIMVFVAKLRQIAAVVKGFVDSIVSIAEGKVDAAAERVESSLAGILTLAINFLAGFAGIGKVADKIMGVIEKVRDPIDKAITWLVNWIVSAAKGLFAKGKAAVQAVVDWWKQKKPFQTSSGAKHEISFVGDEKTAVAMVASESPMPVSQKLDEFAKQASAKNASEAEKKGASLIQATKALAAKDPNDAALVINMQQLFDIYTEGAGGAVKQLKIVRQTSPLGPVTVGVSMTADWLGPKDIAGGTGPEGAVHSDLMDLLVTEPRKRNPDKFVRGHLLNEGLGGRGNAENLFPITGNANSQHLHSTENKVKGWMSKEKRWAFYEVKVQNIKSELSFGPKSPQNFVECAFVCHAILKDATGKVEEDFSTTISSTYKVPEKATVTDNLKAKTGT